MKFIKGLALASLAAVNADMDGVKDRVNAICGQLTELAASNHPDLDPRVKEVLENTDMCKSGRSFASSWGQKMIESINGYGCWCYFQDEHGQGRGKPQNEVDGTCKKLHDGYTCILMDSEAEGDLDCVPWDVVYNGATALGLDPADPLNNVLASAIRRSCDNSNRVDKCAQRACKVEGFFVMNLFRHFLAGVIFDPSLKHTNGFNPKLDCPLSGNRIDSDKECCGDYPLRFPYKTLDGARQCCEGKTYNAQVLQCCEDGKTKSKC